MVKIYAVQLGEQLNNELFESLLQFVDEDKRHRIKRFYHWQDAHRTLYADLLIRSVVITKFNMKNSDVSFSIKKYKKPFITTLENFHFNLSHSGDWIICAIDKLPIGADVEQIRDIDLKISKRFFSTEEDDELMSKDSVSILPFFYTLWTLKESYIKAIGKGLYHPLNEFTMKFFDNGEIGLFLKGKHFKDLFFKTYPIDDSYKMAVCSSTNEFSDSIIVKEIEEIIECFNL